MTGLWITMVDSVEVFVFSGDEVEDQSPSPAHSDMGMSLNYFNSNDNDISLHKRKFFLSILP